MISGNSKLITQKYYQSILKLSEENKLSGSFDMEKHQWVIEDEEKWLAKVSIPWNMQVNHAGALSPKDDFHLALVMIRAGIAVTGYFHNGVMVDHKVFRAYMVRQKQGKSQIKYLKTKGKSRAGSRLRLGESEQFFEEINERLQSYHTNYHITMWGMSCGMTLFPYFFASATPPPFSKKQENLFNIPFHVQQPDFATLKEIHFNLNSYHVIFSDEGKVVFDQIEEIDKREISDEDDW